MRAFWLGIFSNTWFAVTRMVCGLPSGVVSVIRKPVPTVRVPSPSGCSSWTVACISCADRSMTMFAESQVLMMPCASSVRAVDCRKVNITGGRGKSSGGRARALAGACELETQAP